MGSLRGCLALLSLALLTSVARPAAAVDEATRSMIREISSEGVAAYQAGEYEKARKKLDQAFSMLPTAPLGLWSARTLEKLGLLVEARERYLAAERAPIDPGGDRDPQLAAREDAEAERKELESRIPKVVVRVQSEDGSDSSGEISLTVAGKTLPAAFVDTAIPVNPGALEIVVVRGGMQARRTIEIREGERKEVTLTLEPAPPGAADTSPASEGEADRAQTPPADESRAQEGSKGSWQPLTGWITIGVGAGALVLGGVTSVLVYDKLSQLGCNQNGCPPGTSEADMAEGNTLRTVSTIGYVAGGVLVATGVTLLLTTPKKERQVAFQPTWGGGTLLLRGTF